MSFLEGPHVLNLLNEAGPFGFLMLGGGGLGLLLALVTAALAAAKSSGAKIAGALCGLVALGVLGLGVAGFRLGMTTTLRAVANVPDDMKELLIHKGSEEARASLLIALGAAALPMIAGLLAMVLGRAWRGLLVALLSAAAWGGVLYLYTRPLPPAGPTLAEVPGLQLPHAHGTAMGAGAFVALTPDGAFVNGTKVARPADALADPLVQQRNTNVLVVLADARVRFAPLLELLESAAAHGRHRFQLVVLGEGGEHQMIPIRDDAEAPADPLALTLFVAPRQLQIGARGGALQPLTHDWKALNDRLAEIRATFPDNRTLRVSADADVTVEELVKGLEAARERESKLLDDDLVVGRFTVAKPSP
jgi:biopolymer transport protein ExbD